MISPEASYPLTKEQIQRSKYKGYHLSRSCLTAPEPGLGSCGVQSRKRVVVTSSGACWGAVLEPDPAHQVERPRMRIVIGCYLGGDRNKSVTGTAGDGERRGQRWQRNWVEEPSPKRGDAQHTKAGEEATAKVGVRRAPGSWRNRADNAATMQVLATRARSHRGFCPKCHKSHQSLCMAR